MSDEMAFYMKECVRLERALSAAEAGVTKLKKEVEDIKQFMLSSETAYCGSAIMREVLGFFEAAGYGKPGTPNTLWAMSQEAIAKAKAAEDALSSAREEGAAQMRDRAWALTYYDEDCPSRIAAAIKELPLSQPFSKVNET
jgi:hypothetical protein